MLEIEGVLFEHANSSSCRNAKKQNSEMDMCMLVCHTHILNRVYVCVIFVCFLFIFKRFLFCLNCRF